MRTAFIAQIDRLTADLGQMCALAAVSAVDATAAVVHEDVDAAPRVRATLHRLDQLNRRIDRSAFALLALHAPVAHDLRVVMSAFSIAANADRMGALAANIAKTGPAPETARDLFAQMGSQAVSLAETARRAVLGDDAAEAERLLRDDAVMNDLHRELLTTVLTDGWPHGVQSASDVALLGRFYERFADNAVEIARKVIFQARGEAPLADPALH
ncbi:phosphate signaling complex protein PhoU [Mycolicibacterium neoaurum]|uniref:phosphate signaling complex protein PhoU n=1 Tax=Mycolicibacterium neoaurum TaxID=1795 RepID=UPI00248B444F|nr:phosphate signaling complex protein PhoU [Mycolicibacterium neoaurum]WBP93565.1 phosphate signaling complex protein PhoU [Mycolicibacterium neoaurum]WBS07358.1 phosphate signaling complex protein PhoU [Mycolicibacterium neoaurum]